MATENWSAYDLDQVDFQGLIHEDVMNQIWDISKIPLPLTDMIGSGTSKNQYKSWTTDELASPDVSNAVADGADIDQDDTKAGERIGNHHQESVKMVKVSTRAQNVDTIGRADELAYQVMMRQQELRRDVEAIACTEQASVEDTSDAAAGGTAGKSAGFFAMIRDTTETIPGTALVPADGAHPGFSAGLFQAVTAGTPRALSETLLRDAVEVMYNKNGSGYKLMTIPTLIRKLSEYLFTSSARIASLYSDTGQGTEAAVAKGSVKVFVTDFDFDLEFVPNRLMQPEASNTYTNVGIIDPAYLELSYLQGYVTEPLAKTGLSDKRLMHVDWTLVCKSLDAHGQICTIDHTTAVVA